MVLVTAVMSLDGNTGFPFSSIAISLNGGRERGIGTPTGELAIKLPPRPVDDSKGTRFPISIELCGVGPSEGLDTGYTVDPITDTLPGIATGFPFDC